MAVTSPDPRTGKYAPVDLNRGVRQCQHPSGFFVSMYEDDPGLYFSEDGSPVDDAVAADAGFDVQRFRVLRERNRRVAEAKEKIEREMQGELERIDGEFEAGAPPHVEHPDAGSEPDAAGDAEESESPGGWKMKKYGRGAGARYDVIDAEGRVVETGLTKEQAEALLAGVGV
jgi:hypothetical protein